MTPTNEQMAHECIASAEKSKYMDIGMYEVTSAQVYATLALVDAVRSLAKEMASAPHNADHRPVQSS